jgi:uncharacterized protein YndB with AHSA1/START domain
MDSMHEIAVSAPLQKVFDAWTTKDGLTAWWTSNVTIRDEGRLFVFGFDGGKIEFNFRLDESVPGERAVWTGVAGDTMPAEWIGTRLDVQVAPAKNGRIRLRFAHRGWRSTEGAFCECNTTWGELMYRLRDYCEGRPRGPLFT